MHRLTSAVPVPLPRPSSHRLAACGTHHRTGTPADGPDTPRSPETHTTAWRCTGTPRAPSRSRTAPLSRSETCRLCRFDRTRSRSRRVPHYTSGILNATSDVSREAMPNPKGRALGGGGLRARDAAAVAQLRQHHAWAPTCPKAWPRRRRRHPRRSVRRSRRLATGLSGAGRTACAARRYTALTHSREGGCRRPLVPASCPRRRRRTGARQRAGAR